MRLTLRTMLAYLDGMFDEPDKKAEKEALGKKIEESKFASDLVARIRNVIHKPRLPAPLLEGKGIGLDPNSVADYLETLLPADRVPDFEKICLESDKHLAEVAACHQILAMVLRQPAEFNANMRERMYRVGARVADAHARQKAAASESRGQAKGSVIAEPPVVAALASPSPPHDGHAKAEVRSPREQPARKDEKKPRNEPAARSEHAPREKPEVPDYLREARRTRLLPILATVVFAFVLAAVLLRAIGPFDRSHPLARLVLGKGEAEVVKYDNTNTPNNVTPEPKPADVKPVPDKTPAKPNDTPAPVEPGSKTPDGGEYDDPTKPPPLVPDPPGTVPDKPETDVKPPVEPKPIDPKPAELKPAPAKPVALGPAVVVGRFVSSEQQVLARFDSKSGEWSRLANDAPLNSGDRLLVLPTYRPQITLVSGMQVTLAGESLVELLPPDDKEVAHLKVEYGKLTIVTSGKPGAQIGLDLGNRRGIAALDHVDSTLAAEVRRFRYPGDTPDMVASTQVSELFPGAGSIEWTEEGGSKVKLGSGQVLIYENDKPGFTADIGDQPAWVQGKGQNPIDRMASQALADKLQVDRSLLLSLQERVEPSKETKVEVRSLAIRSLMYLDVFEPFVISLNDDKLKSYWNAQFDSAQEALARSSESAAEVRKGFEAQRAEDSASLYKLLIGYSPEELNRSGATKLIEYLDHESLDFRVLASETLLRITGKALSYRPENQAPRRTDPVRRWKQEQKAGTLVYKTVPSPIVERKGAAKTPATPKESPEPSKP